MFLRILIISFFVCVLSNNGFSKQLNSNLSKKEILLRTWKAYNINYADVNRVKSWLRKFDNDWNSYKNNEFLLNEKISQTIPQIKMELDAILEDNLYYVDIDAEFGEYNFQQNKFECNPFERESVVIEGYSGGYFTGDNNLESALFVSQTDFFNGIYLNNEEAKQLLASRTTPDKYNPSKNIIDRKIYLRIYFSQNTKDIKLNNNSLNLYPKNLITGKALYIECWDTKCRNQKLIYRTYNTDEISKSKYNDTILNSISEMSNNNPYNNIPPQEEKNGFKKIMNWTNQNEDCDYEHFEIQGKIVNTNPSTTTIYLKFYTNYKYYIKPGFKIIFYIKQTDVKFSFSITDTYIEDAASVLKVNITNEALKNLIDFHCNSFNIQMNGTPVYQEYGSWCKSEGTIKRNISYADFTLTETKNNNIGMLLLYQPEIQSNNKQFKLGFFGLLDQTEGCSCYFSLSELDYNNNVYIYSDDEMNSAYISIDGKILKFKFNSKEISNSTIITAINKDYNVVITLPHKNSVVTEESESTTFNDGTIEITNIHTQDKIVRTIYGVCGC